MRLSNPKPSCARPVIVMVSEVNNYANCCMAAFHPMSFEAWRLPCPLDQRMNLPLQGPDLRDCKRLIRTISVIVEWSRETVLPMRFSHEALAYKALRRLDITKRPESSLPKQ